VSIDRFFGKIYSKANYNCAHFSIEVMKYFTGVDASEVIHGVLCAPSKRKLDITDSSRIKILAKPVSPCFVLMKRRLGDSHIGVWYKGKVLHLLESSSVQYVPFDIASIGFTRFRFFQCL
jgi:hypothetical protein